MIRNAESCGWAMLKKFGPPECGRKKRPVFDGECPTCKYWVHRLRIDRLRGKR